MISKILFISYVFATSVFSPASAVTANATSGEYKLTQQLLQTYRKSVRPVRNDSSVLHITLDLSLRQITGVNENEQTISSSIVLSLSWTDEYIQWNASDFGTDLVVLSRGDIWLPGIELLNGYGFSQVALSQDPSVSSTGQVSIRQPLSLTSNCIIHPLLFPYDSQTCALEFVIWSYNTEQVVMSPRDEHVEIDGSTFTSNGEWDLKEVEAEEDTLQYACCPGNYSLVSFHIAIKRQPLFYMFNLFLSCALFTVLTAFVYFIPCETGEKMSMAVTLFLSLTVFMIVFAQNLPSTSDEIPIISRYFTCTLLLQFFCTVTTVLVLRIYHGGRQGQRPPAWARAVVATWLARVVCVKSWCGPCSSDKVQPLSENDTGKEDLSEHGIDFLKGRHSVISVANERRKRRPSLPHQQNTNDSAFASVIDLLKSFENGEAEKAQKIATEWEEMARILDRFFLLLFVIGAITLHVVVIGQFYLTKDEHVELH